jgi:5-methylcytosine-specific restriction endonuclease McrA
VWTRDDGRCAFVGADGRCRETGWLEIHHVVPFARGGLTTTENLELRCRAHNAYEAEREFGARVPSAAGSPRPATTTLSGQSSQGAATSRQRRELTTSLT